MDHKKFEKPEKSKVKIIKCEHIKASRNFEPSAAFVHPHEYKYSAIQGLISPLTIICALSITGQYNKVSKEYKQCCIQLQGYQGMYLLQETVT